MIMTMIGEESFKIYLEAARFGLIKSDSLEQGFVLDLAHVYCVMNACEIDEIERTSAHNEQRLEILQLLAGCDIVNETATVGELELRDARKFSVGICCVSEQIGIEFHAASLAERLLFFFCLNG